MASVVINMGEIRFDAKGCRFNPISHTKYGVRNSGEHFVGTRPCLHRRPHPLVHGHALPGRPIQAAKVQPCDQRPGVPQRIVHDEGHCLVDTRLHHSPDPAARRWVTGSHDVVLPRGVHAAVVVSVCPRHSKATSLCDEHKCVSTRPGKMIVLE